MEVKKTRWECPTCHKVFSIRLDATPPEICRHCQDASIPVFAATETLNDILQPKGKWNNPARAAGALVRPVATLLANVLPSLASSLIFGGALAWVFFWFQPPQFAALSYFGCAAFCCGLGVAATRRWPHRRGFIKVATAAGTLAFLVLFGSVDRFEDRWERDGKNYIDTRMRWGGRVIHRMVWQRDNNGFWSLSGPMSQSGKPHGEFVSFSVPGGRERLWFWYGESVSEGEWHLRNK